MDAPTAAEMQESAPEVDAESLIALERAVWEDLAAGDFEGVRARMTDDFVLVNVGGTVTGADDWLAQTSQGMASCETEDWSIDRPQVTVLSPTSAFLTYEGRTTMGCNGEPMHESEGFFTTVWVQRDGDWKMAYFSAFERG
ncbi:MAG: nuclear transport factor 2 family protein [Gemmatimonadota bacterium]